MVEESPQEASPRRKDERGGRRKPSQNSLAAFQAAAPSQPLGDRPLCSGRLRPGRLSPPRALFGRAPYLPLGSPPPSLRSELGKPQHREPNSSQRAGVVSGAPPNPSRQAGVEKGEGTWPSLGWAPGGQRLPLGGRRREVAICAGRSVLIKPYPRGASAGPGLRARPSVRCGPQCPTLGPPATAHRPRAEPGLPPDRRGLGDPS